MFKNRAPARDVLEISSIYLFKRDVLGGAFWYRIRWICRSNLGPAVDGEKSCTTHKKIVKLVGHRLY